jgi:hypothetical protein
MAPAADPFDVAAILDSVANDTDRDQPAQPPAGDDVFFSRARERRRRSGGSS